MIFFVTFSSANFAAEMDFKICAAGGFWAGAGDRFLSGLALHIRGKKNLNFNPTCSVIWKNAYETGEYASKTGKVLNPEEEIIIQQANDFGTQVYEALAKNINF